MPSDKLTKDQRTLNKLLNYDGYITFTSSEYEKDDNAIKIFEQYIKSKDQPMERMKLYLLMNDLLSKNKKKNVKISTMVQKLAVEELFKLTNESIMERIMHPFYEENYCQCEGTLYFTEELQNKVHKWVELCKRVDQYYIQYEKDKVEWNRSAKAKKLYIEKWSDLSSYILFNESKYIKRYVKFLKKGYGLKQRTRVQAEYLEKLKLPNIDYKIAKEVVANSSLLK